MSAGTLSGGELKRECHVAVACSLLRIARRLEAGGASKSVIVLETRVFLCIALGVLCRIRQEHGRAADAAVLLQRNVTGEGGHISL